jgi:hypothetical protein
MGAGGKFHVGTGAMTYVIENTNGSDLIRATCDWTLKEVEPPPQTLFRVAMVIVAVFASNRKPGGRDVAMNVIEEDRERKDEGVSWILPYALAPRAPVMTVS